MEALWSLRCRASDCLPVTIDGIGLRMDQEDCLNSHLLIVGQLRQYAYDQVFRGQDFEDRNHGGESGLWIYHCLACHGIHIGHGKK